MTTWADLLQKQTLLREKFEAIEHANNQLEWYGEIPADCIDNPQAQAKVRRRCWEIVEEVGEALDLMWCGGNPREEIADAFHYLIELCSLFPDMQVGADALVAETFAGEVVTLHAEAPRERYWLDFIASIAMTANLLKNRPHKRRDQHRKTDPKVFDEQLTTALFAFIRGCIATGITAEQLIESYNHKALINEQRIEGP